MTVYTGSKAGFTLLEVILSIAIMLIMTTMMMNGFAATMTYSYHTSIYSNTAGSNYSTAIKAIADNSKLGKGAYASLGKGTTADANLKTMVASQAITGVGTIKLSVQEFRAAGGAGSASGYSVAGINTNLENWGDVDGSYANNRTSFYYLPAQMGDPYTNGTNNHGRFRVFYKNSGANQGYYWIDTKIVDDNGGVVPASAWTSATPCKFT